MGALRSEAKIVAALDVIGRLTEELGNTPPGDGDRFDMRRIEWFDLRNMLLVARSVATTALARCESRGAHQREDFSEMLPEWQKNQVVRLRENNLEISTATAFRQAAAQ